MVKIVVIIVISYYCFPPLLTLSVPPLPSGLSVCSVFSLPLSSPPSSLPVVFLFIWSPFSFFPFFSNLLKSVSQVSPGAELRTPGLFNTPPSSGAPLPLCNLGLHYRFLPLLSFLPSHFVRTHSRLFILSFCRLLSLLFAAI
ncbi:uncharacterized protein BO66DRAFT_77802 [Aspergillus aculeatinus CBS 121060]|uniref:Uncharacterized protein n=1 Tax=Aspergillus aculeatinus CBS 121060 TaxID=1448322 RepID=A0ACD1HAN6_9EURO|nr:hypothetical protein BO66DRAFT_77802 [Aspergillus aculeatinus CBS 121060]RAH70661.1 hypothetical protein BO66DRAFT_77802 [Aspergillus aculeatinus CBS 121060]